MPRVTRASRRLRKMGAVPVFGFTRAKSAAASGKQRSGSLDGVGIVQVEGAFGLVELSLFPAEYESAELEARVDVGEEVRQSCSRAAVLKIETAHRPARWWIPT